MLEIAVVLFALDEFDSPAVAGAAAFLAVFPGLIAAPVVGTLLDRFGRIRLICLDYLTMASALLAISALSLASSLTAGLYLAIVSVFGVTQMFSEAGLRSVLPRMVPGHLWERVNAVDSSSYLIAWIIGPPVAATLVGAAGGEVAFLVIAGFSVAAFVCLRSVREPTAGAAGRTRVGIGRQALEGLRYVARNATLRGLGISVCVSNLSWGMTTILVPVLVVDRFEAPHALVGLAFTASGVAGATSGLLYGQVDTRGTEVRMLVGAKAGLALSALLLLPAVLTTSSALGLTWVFLAMAVMGFSSGPWNIAIFTLRQRRTDPGLMGRAFAISMAFNWSGLPVGAAVAGSLADRSLLVATAVLSVAAACSGAVLAAVLVPRHDGATVSGAPRPQPPER
jgi:MFS family permease